MKRWWFILIALYCAPLTAGIEAELQKAFNSFNSGINATQGGAYQGQAAGYYTGGSLYLRQPSRTVYPLNFQLPSIGAGSCNMDLYMGAFSYINSQKLIETLRAIGANSTTYAFSLALTQMSPQIASKIEQIHAGLNWANELSINTCHDAKRLVNNAASLLEEGAIGGCIRQNLKEGTDYFKAKTECQTQEKVNSKNQQAKAQGEPTISNVNVVWEMIQKHPLLKSLDRELKYLLMSLTGTIIFKTEGTEPLRPHFYLSKLHSHEIIAGLSSNKPFQVYSCDDKDCLSLKEKTITLKKENTFVGQIYRILASMEEKILKDEIPLTEAEQGFLELTRLPVYKLLNVQSAFYKGINLFAVEQYSEVIAMDVLYAFIDNSIFDILSSDKNGLIPGPYIEQLHQMLGEARRRAMELRLLQVQKTGTIEDMSQQPIINALKRRIYG